MATIASAFVQLMPSFQGGQREIERQMGGSLDSAGRSGGRRFGGAMQGAIGGLASKIFAPLAAAAATVSIGGFLKDSIAQASDLNEAGTKLAAIFGTEGTAAVEAFAAAGAQALGQNKLAVLDASATFGTFGKAAGLAGTDLAGFSTGFAGLSTDLASFYNTSPEEAIEAIGAALRGEAEPIRKYGVLMDDASLKQEALALGLISTTKDALTPQQKVLAAQALIYKQTADAQGDFERTSGGLANQQRILSAQFTDLKGRIGTALLPVVTKFVTFLNNSLVPGIEKAANFLKPFGEAAKGVFDILVKGDFTGGFSAFGIEEDSALIGYLFQLRDGLVQIGGFVKGTVVPALQQFAAVIGPIIGGYLKQMGAFITGTVVPALIDLGRFVKANVLPVLAEFGAFVTAKLVPALQKIGAFILGAVVPALISIYSTVVANVLPILKTLWTQFATNILPVLQQVFAVITDKVVPVLIRVGQAIVPVISFIVKLVVNILGFLIPALINFAGPIIGFVIKAIGAIIGWLADFVGWVLDVGGNIRAFVLVAVAKFMDFKDRIVFAFTVLMARARAIFEQIKAWIVGKIAEVVATAQRIIAFKNKAVAAFTAFKDEAIRRVGELIAKVKGLPGEALAALGNLASTLKQKGEDLIQGLIDGIGAKIKAVKDKISEVAGAIGDFLPGSPVKEGPLRKWNNGMAGKRLVGMLADGLGETARIDQAMRGLTSSIATPRLNGSVGVVGHPGAGGLGTIVTQVVLDGQIVAESVNNRLGDMAERSVYA